MKKIRKFLKPTSMIMACLILFVSCEQYDQDLNLKQQAFDYNVFQEFKNSNHLKSVLKTLESTLKNTNSTEEMNREILSTVNDEMGTSLTIPDKALTISAEMDADDIYDISLSEGWLSEQDIVLIEEFSEDIQVNGLDIALENYENQILPLNLPDNQFDKHNAFVNIIKSLDHENPELLDFRSQHRSWWRCGLAVVALAAAIASVGSCVTVVACGVAGALIINAGYAVADQCG